MKVTPNSLYEIEGRTLRILAIEEEKVLVIDCEKKTMPVWVNKPREYKYINSLDVYYPDYKDISFDEKEIIEETGFSKTSVYDYIKTGSELLSEIIKEKEYKETEKIVVNGRKVIKPRPKERYRNEANF